MTGLGRYRRAILVVGVTLLLFAWVAALAAPKENTRFLRSLHAAHQGEKYRASLAALYGQTGREIDDCGACHVAQGPVANLVSGLAPVDATTCGRCHAPREEHARTFGGRDLGQAFGTAEARGRMHRPAHQSTAGGPTVLGLRVSESGANTLPMSCGECHPDHRGADFMQKQRVEGKLVLHDMCLGCHVPSAAIMTFLEGQKCGDCHGEHTPNEGMDKVEAAAREHGLTRYMAAVGPRSRHAP